MSEDNKIILSIIIPVYNVELYLERCLDSVLCQVKENMEVILVDDGSKDNSGNICDKYKNRYGDRINVIHQSNAGLSAARNTGIENANGEYLYFLDSDDFLSENFIETVYMHLIKRKYDIIEFKAFWMTKEGDVHLKYTEKVYEKSNIDMILELIRTYSDCYIWLRIYNNRLFRNVRFPVGRQYEDIATYYKLLINSKKNLFVDSQLYIYNRLNLNSITRKVDMKNIGDRYISINEMCKALEAVVKQSNLDPIYIEYYKRRDYIYMLRTMHMAGFKDNDIYKQIFRYLNENNKYNYIKYKNYGLKTLFVYKLLKVFHRF